MYLQSLSFHTKFSLTHFPQPAITVDRIALWPLHLVYQAIAVRSVSGSLWSSAVAQILGLVWCPHHWDLLLFDHDSLQCHVLTDTWYFASRLPGGYSFGAMC